jgi:hypothetical protein
MKPWVFWALALLLGLAGAALVLDHMKDDSATMDEPFHALASAEYAISGTYYANLEHPPLAKLLAGVSLRGAGARPPRIPKPFAIEKAEQPASFARHNTLPAEALFYAARLPFPFLQLLLVALVAGAARAFWNDAAGLGAAALVAFEPNLLAHAGVLHTDVGAALFSTGALVFALLALELRSYLRWVLCGLFLGLALATKFSAIFLIPVLFVLVLLHHLWEARRLATPESARHPVAAFLAAVLLAIVTLLATYSAAMRHMPEPEAERAVTTFLHSRGASQGATGRVLTLTRVTPELGHYVAGLTGVALQNRAGGGVNVLEGRLSTKGFWNYFFVALAVKLTISLLAISALAFLLLVARRARLDFPLAGLLIALASVFLPFAGTSYNIGVRHVLLVMPLLAMLAAGAVALSFARSTAALVLALAASGQLYETWRVHPHEISFFNALAGGPERGAEWLNDSNLDWGQDLGRLVAVLRGRGLAQGATIAYFGGGDPVSACPEARLYDPRIARPAPGVYAVSSFLLAAGPELMTVRGRPAEAAGYQALRDALRARGTLLARVGYSILIYRLEAREERR